jgi:hypothetical protein
MAQLTIISETGMFHSVCRCTWPDGVKWYGFAPVKHREPHGQGAVHTESRAQYINHYISFDISDFLLRSAIGKAVEKYKAATYTIGVRDCVSFSADVARGCNLAVPLVNMTPWGLVQILRVNNYTELH